MQLLIKPTTFDSHIDFTCVLIEKGTDSKYRENKFSCFQYNKAALK